MGVILTALLPMVPGILQTIEKLFPPGSGADKKAAAVAILDQAASHIVASKALPGDKPGPDAIGGAIEGVLQQMKDSGTLTAPSVNSLNAAWLFAAGKMYKLSVAEQN